MYSPFQFQGNKPVQHEKETEKKALLTQRTKDRIYSKMLLCNGKIAGRHQLVEGLKRNRQWEDTDPTSVVLESVIMPSRCLTCDQLSSLGASCPLACACRFGRARKSDKTQTDFTPLKNVGCMYCRSWRMRHGKLVLCKCLAYLRGKFLEKGDTVWRYVFHPISPHSNSLSLMFYFTGLATIVMLLGMKTIPNAAAKLHSLSSPPPEDCWMHLISS